MENIQDIYKRRERKHVQQHKISFYIYYLLYSFIHIISAFTEGESNFPLIIYSIQQ